MKGLQESFAELRKLILRKFATVRFTTVQMPEQFLVEVRAIGRERLPGVLVVYDGTTIADGVREDQVTLVLVDRFRADSDDRALSVLEATENLLSLFPADGQDLDGVWTFPRDCQIASPDRDFAALALGVSMRQSNG